MSLRLIVAPALNTKITFACIKIKEEHVFVALKHRKGQVRPGATFTGSVFEDQDDATG